MINCGRELIFELTPSFPTTFFYRLSLIYFYFSRNTLNEIYFGKTRDIVNGLRSVQPLDQSKQQDDLRKDLVIALASKNVTKAE